MFHSRIGFRESDPRQQSNARGSCQAILRDCTLRSHYEAGVAAQLQALDRYLRPMQKRAAYLALVVILALGGLAAAVLKLRVSHGPVIYAQLGTAPGLREGAVVSFRGIAVGHVTHLAFEPNALRLTLSLERADVPVSAGDAVRVRATGLLGDAGVEIVPAANPGPPLADGGTLHEVDPDALRRAWLRRMGVPDPARPAVDSAAPRSVP